MPQVNKNIAIVYANTFLVAFGSYLQKPILPLYAASLGASIAEVGFIVAVQGILPVFTAVHLGWFSDRFGRKPFLIAGPALFSVSFLGMALSPSVISLMGWSLLAGLGQSVWEPSVKTAVADVADPARLGKAYGTFALFLQTGFSMGPAVGSVLGAYAGYQNAFLVNSAIIALASIITLGFPRRVAKGKRNENVKLGAELRNVSREGKIRVAWSSVLVSSLTFAVLVSFISLYAVSVGVPPVAVGFLLTAQAIANALARIPVGFMMDYRRKMTGPIVLALVLGGVGLFAVGFLGSFALLLVPMVLVGFSSAIVNVGGNILTAEATTSSNRGIAQGMLTVCRNAATSFGPSLLGIVVMAYGYTFGFGLFGVITVIGALLTWPMGKQSAPAREAMAGEPAAAGRA